MYVFIYLSVSILNIHTYINIFIYIYMKQITQIGIVQIVCPNLLALNLRYEEAALYYMVILPARNRWWRVMLRSLSETAGDNMGLRTA